MVSATSYGDEIAGKKIYESRYMHNAPYGVMAWSESSMVKGAQNKESRFVDYNSDAAKGLILDATTDRNVEKDAAVAARQTAFYSVYNEKGWYLYIEAEEPLINELLDNVVDPQSPARKEGYEIFFAPGLHTVPYYQIFTHPFAGNTDYIDWGIPHRHYRSLKEYAKVESSPLEKGFGTFMFVPWEAMYERLPLNGDYWRFTIIRWMPFGKAGGTTWGGQVHDTGNFGLLHFEAPKAEQKLAMQKRVLRAAWFKYLATSKAATTYWSDAKIGDREFYDGILKPVIEEYSSLGQSLGKPDDWNAATLQKAAAVHDDWMEFEYKVSELRREYLLSKRMQSVP
jgi:hypothetical protein